MSWPMVKIKDAPIYISDGNYSAKYPKSNEFVQSGIPFLSGNNIINGVVNEDRCKFITSELHGTLKKGHVKTNDVLITTRGNIGNAAIVPERLNDANINAQLVLLRPDNTEVDSKFLKYAFDTPLVKRQIEMGLTGSALKQLPVRSVKELEIPLPPLEEQKRIATILDKADAIRRKRQQAIQLADEFLRSVFLDMFGDPVTNPKGWEVARLGDVVESQLGKMLSKKAKEGKSPKKYLRNANVRWRKFVLNDLLEMDFNSNEIKKFELKNGDLLVCEGGEVGRCSIWRDNVSECYYQKALHRVRPLHEVLTPEYLQEYFFWMSKRGGLNDSVSEVTFSHLTAEKLKELRIPLPPIDIQKQFSSRYRKIDALMLRYESIVCVENENFSSISQKAFSGEL